MANVSTRFSKPVFTFRSEITDSAVRKEFEQLYSGLHALFDSFLNANGTFGNITVNNLQVVNNPELPGPNGEPGTGGAITIINQFGETVTAAGNDEEVQFNEGGLFGARSGLRWKYQQAANVALGTGAAATVANTGAGAYAATLRYYQIQWRTLSGTTITAASALTPAVSFTPSGTGAAARVTRPAITSAAITHWAVYGSADGTTYKQISSNIAIATTTYDDSVAPASYAGDSPLPSYTGAATLIATTSEDPSEQLALIRSVDAAGATQGAISFIPHSADYMEQYFGAEFVNGQWVARSDIVGLLSHTSTGIGNLGLTLYGSQTPGSPVDFSTQSLSFALAFDTSAVPGGSLFLVGTQQSSIVTDAIGLNQDGGAGSFGIGLYHLDIVGTPLTAARALRFRTGDTDRVIRFDGVGTNVTFT